MGVVAARNNRRSGVGRFMITLEFIVAERGKDRSGHGIGSK